MYKSIIVGVDEAGRGPLAGVVAGCALFFKKNPNFPIKDSKKLTHNQREEIFCWLKDNSVFSIGVSSVDEIDRMNILQATFLAFNRAISGLLEKFPKIKDAIFIIDGNMFKTDLKIKYKCIKKADEKIKEVSAASIIAKVTRDYLMNVASILFPAWSFHKHKGYPTKEHIYLIEKYSISPLHRKTFISF